MNVLVDVRRPASRRPRDSRRNAGITCVRQYEEAVGEAIERFDVIQLKYTSCTARGDEAAPGAEEDIRRDLRSLAGARRRPDIAQREDASGGRRYCLIRSVVPMYRYFADRFDEIRK